MDVEVAGFDLLGGASERCLVKTHACDIKSVCCKSCCLVLKLLTVGEVRLEQVVVSSRDFRQDLCEVHTLLVVEVHQSSLVCLCDDHDLKRPGCPPGTSGPEALVLEYRALALFTFKLGVVLQEMAVVVVLSVLLHPLHLDAGLLWKARGCPDLAVRMRVGATHGGTLVLENLHVAVLVFRCLDEVAV